MLLEKLLSIKQKKIAKLAGHPEKLDAHDFAALRSGKKPVEEATGDTPEEIEKKKLAISTVSTRMKTEEADGNKMTAADKKQRERYVRSMKKNIQGFKERYGARANNVMYATATKMAMKEELDKPTPSVEEIAKKHGVDASMIENELEKGIKVEMEHTTNKSTAREIALDHLNERPDYYKKLKMHVEGYRVIIAEAEGEPVRKVAIGSKVYHKDHGSGKVVNKSTGPAAYHWADVKFLKGDTIRVNRKHLKMEEVEDKDDLQEASYTSAASMHAATRKRDPQKENPKHDIRVGDSVTTKDGKSGKVVFVNGEKVQVKGTNSYYPDRITHHKGGELKKGVAEGLVDDSINSGYSLKLIDREKKLHKGGNDSDSGRSWPDEYEIQIKYAIVKNETNKVVGEATWNNTGDYPHFRHLLKVDMRDGVFRLKKQIDTRNFYYGKPTQKGINMAFSKLLSTKKQGLAEGLVDDNQINENVPISARTLYAQTYIKHAKTIGKAKEAEQKAYDAVKKKHGIDVHDRLKKLHVDIRDQNKKRMQDWYNKKANEETQMEGRQSQLHPIEGHEYHKKPDEQLKYIMKDAGEAAIAMKGHSPKAESKYLDQVNDAATVLAYRKKNGMQDWYKKKYGHK